MAWATRRMSGGSADIGASSFNGVPMPPGKRMLTKMDLPVGTEVFCKNYPKKGKIVEDTEKRCEDNHVMAEFPDWHNVPQIGRFRVSSLTLAVT